MSRYSTDTSGCGLSMAPPMTIDRVRAAVAAALLAVAVVAYWTLRPGDSPKPGAGPPRAPRKMPLPAITTASTCRFRSSLRSRSSRYRRRHRSVSSPGAAPIPTLVVPMPDQRPDHGPLRRARALCAAGQRRRRTYTVADLKTRCGCWRTFPRTDSPAFRAGQQVPRPGRRVSRP